MKFVELKKKLVDKIENVYLISGNDRFLCYKALELVQNKLDISFPDMNSVTLSGETTNVKEIIESASVFPFGDPYRLVIVRGFNPKIVGNKKLPDETLLLDYINNPNPQSVVVFFNIDGDDFFKNIKNQVVHIDCDKLELSSLVNVLCNDFKRANISISMDDAKLLALFCNSDMARIESETKKLIAYAASTGKITEQDIRDNVIEDKEYQIFELSEILARGEKIKALNMIQALTLTGKSGFSILTPLYNNYRRVLFTAINSNMRDADIAQALGVKEYAIKMCRNQARVFTPKKLKKIVDMLAVADKNIKIGKIKEDAAVKTIIVSILNMRG